ncbi:MAG: sensor histidine kinase [Promethearchaeota archaeon]
MPEPLAQKRELLLVQITRDCGERSGMDVKPTTKTVIQLAVSLLITLSFAVIGLLILPDLTWVHPNTNISIQALLGLLAIMGGAIALLRSRQEVSLSNVILYSGFLFLGILHMMEAVLHILQFIPPGSTIATFRLVANILEITVFIGLIASSFFLKIYNDIPLSKSDSHRIGVGIISCSIACYSFYYIVILPFLPFFVLYTSGLFLTISSIIIGITTMYFVVQSKNFRTDFNKIWVLNGFLLFLFVTPIYFVSLISPVQIWQIVVLFLMVGFISFNISISVPQFHSTGLSKKNSFLYAFFLNVFVVLPFAAAFILNQTFSGILAIMPRIELYLLIRIGAALISLGLGVLIYMYSKQKFTRSFIPLMLAFFTWVIVDVALLILSPMVSTYNESLVPYIIGYLTVFVLLVMAVRWKQKPLKSSESGLPVFRIIFSIICITAIVTISLLIENGLLISSGPILYNFPLDRIILIAFSFLNVFWFSILGYLYLKESSGEITIEILALTLLMLWIIPGILKSTFGVWEWGWWAAEFLLLGGLMVAPIIFGIAYLRALRTTEEAEKRATLYADILAHDITNYHQAIMTSLELIELEDVPEELHEQAIGQIHQSLSRADHLIKNVRRLGKVEHMPETTFQPLDLVTYVKLAFDQVSRALGTDEFVLKLNQPEGYCYVDANLLLVDLFQNLIRNAMEYSNDTKRIEVNFKRLNSSERSWWEIQIIDFGRGIPPERKDQLFNRYMDGAHGSGLGLSVVRALSEAFGGWVAVQDRVPGQHQEGTVFLVYLPVSITEPP